MKHYGITFSIIVSIYLYPVPLPNSLPMVSFLQKTSPHFSIAIGHVLFSDSPILYIQNMREIILGLPLFF